MNKSYSFLFSAFFVTTFVCSASEQSITQYDDRQLSVMNIIKKRSDLLEKESHQNYTHFVNNTQTLQKSLEYPNNSSLINNDLRLKMAENLKPIMNEIAFRKRVLSYAHNAHHDLSYRIYYLSTIQNKLRSIHKTTITTEEIGQYVTVIGEMIPHSTQSMKDINNSVDPLTQQVYGEIEKEKEQIKRLSNLDTNPSEQNKEIINRLEQFIISLHQAGIEKAEKQEPQIAKLTKAMEANNNEFPAMQIPQLTADTMTDAQEDAIIAARYNKLLKNETRRKTPYVIVSAIAILLAYYCNLHQKLADFISYK